MKSKNSKSRGIKDYFGNPIEPGDIILRPRFGRLWKKEVMKVTEYAIYVKRDNSDYFPNLPRPLKIPNWLGLTYQPLINLTKLNLV